MPEIQPFQQTCRQILPGDGRRFDGNRRLDRRPLALRKLPKEQIFRPSAWTAFGALEPQGADFRACANFGSLYGKYP